ncbi:MAG: ArsA family ATPase [Acidimicrobiales bacterium]
MSAEEGLGQLLAAKEVVVVCGPGGVGKTTVSAAAGLLAAQDLGGRVLVMTIDPARRLATALGLDSLDNDEVQIAPEVLSAGGVEPRGELWVAQLDTKQSWDDLVGRHAPDPATRDAILENSLYENVTGKFVESHQYIAMERLHELHSSGRYDLIIVDTPPSRSAVDFLDAPQKMADFFGSRLLRWLTVPYRSRLFNAASRPFYSVADRVLGQQFLREVADFFLLFQTMYDGFVERAGEVERTLHNRRTSFVVVSTLEPASISESEFFMQALEQRDLNLGAVVLNRALPGYFTTKAAITSARELDRQAPHLASMLETDMGDTDQSLVETVLREVSSSFLDFGVDAARQAELRVELTDQPSTVVTLPLLTQDLVDVRGLATVAEHLRG